jgi:pimeloyl-ACP methyl ester carboxylesterase/DNA-binding winged helix-turn-helix (wHTH) protein
MLLIDDQFELDDALYELRRDGVAVSLEPQAFDVLVYLVTNRDRVVSKEELMDAVWGGRFVSETAVTSRIKQVRRALGDDGQAQRVLRTQHGRGYRIVAPVTEIDPQSAGSSRATVEAEDGAAPGPIRYTTSDGLHIAYQVSGGGDLDIVLISGFCGHLDVDWEDPRHARWLHGLGKLGRLIRFDKRGTGMSDRPSGLPDLETRMHDVLAVMDAVDSRRAVVVGYSEGGPMAVLLAAMHPERVSSLVLFGSYAKRTWAEDHPWAQREGERAEYAESLIQTWDWEADLLARCPSGDEEMQRWWSKRMRAAATPGTIRALLDMNSQVDVRSLLPNVHVPALIIHREGDRIFPVDNAHYLASHLPEAELVLLDGADHLPAGHPDQLLDVMAPFISAAPRPVRKFALAAIVSARGPASAALLAALIDAGGRSAQTPRGDQVVLFDGPATAVRATQDAFVHHPDAGVGLSIAEVAIDHGPVSGPEVERALALAATAASGSIEVTPVVEMLLSGATVSLQRA